MKNKYIMDTLDEYIPNPKCSLNYNKDYELLIATVLSAQCTDERVNKVTKELFSQYDIFKLANSKPEDIIDIIRPCGTMSRKSVYIIEMAKSLVKDYNGKVPNNRTYLENLSGVGHKTANVVLANIFNEPAFAVDTHVSRVSKRLGLVKTNDDVLQIEKKLTKLIPKDRINKTHHQFILFGRYYCKAKNPDCNSCKLKDICKNYNKKL